MGAIITLVWSLVGPTVVQLAITVGLPAALEWLIGKGLPKWLANGLIAIAKAALDQIHAVNTDPGLNPGQKTFLVGAIKADARKKAKDHAIAGYPTDTVDSDNS